jgi:hypothetical protein
MDIRNALTQSLAGTRTVWKTHNQNWIFPLTNRIVGLCVLLSVSIIIWKWNSLPPLVPLLRSRPWGGDRLVPPFWLFVIPFSTLFWHVLNINIIFWLTREHRIFTQVLLLSSIIISILSTVITVAVIFLVI